MNAFRRVRLLALSSWLLLLALGASLAASMVVSASPAGADVKTDLMREAGRLKRIARSVRRDEPSAESEDELQAVAGETWSAPLAAYSFAQGLAGDGLPLTEIDEILLQSRGGAGLHEVGVPRGSPTLQRALSKFRSGGRSSLTVLALRRGDGVFIADPPPELRLKKGDVILVQGRARDADALRKALA